MKPAFLSHNVQTLIRFLEDRRIPFRVNEPLAHHTTLSIGGPALLLAMPTQVAALGPLMEAAAERGLPVIVLGGGSNSLFPDEGFEGLVIKLFMGLGTLHEDQDTVTADADVLLSRLVKTAAARGVTGFDGLAGIPGTVAGAIVNNSGAYGMSTSDQLLSVTVAANGGRLITLGKDEVMWGYRTSTFRRERLPIVSARFAFTPTEDPATLVARTREIQRIRRGKFLGIRSNAGSTFKNPPDRSAGRLLEDLGLKGIQVGQARLSLTHANVMENLGGATARDAQALLDKVQATVLEKTGIQLERELEVHGPATTGGVKNATA